MNIQLTREITTRAPRNRLVVYKTKSQIYLEFFWKLSALCLILKNKTIFICSWLELVHCLRLDEFSQVKVYRRTTTVTLYLYYMWKYQQIWWMKVNEHGHMNIDENLEHGHNMNIRSTRIILLFFYIYSMRYTRS